MAKTTNLSPELADLHADIDAVIAKLQAAKSRRGGTLQCDLGAAGDRLLGMAARVRSNFPAYD